MNYFLYSYRVLLASLLFLGLFCTDNQVDAMERCLPPAPFQCPFSLGGTTDPSLPRIEPSLLDKIRALKTRGAAKSFINEHNEIIARLFTQEVLFNQCPTFAGFANEVFNQCDICESRGTTKPSCSACGDSSYCYDCLRKVQSKCCPFCRVTITHETHPFFLKKLKLKNDLTE